MAKQKDAVNEYVTKWTSDIKSGVDYMKKYSTQDKWKDWRTQYRGDWGDTIIPVNKMFSMGRAMIPRIYFRSPRVSITATRPEFIRHALVVEAVDNWLIQELKLKKALKRALLHAYLCGTCPIKLGFDSEYGYLPEQAISDDSSTATQVARTEERSIEYNINIKPGLPWALSVMPEDIIIPWGYNDADNVPWIAHRILRPLEDVKQDQKYRNNKDLKGTKKATLGQSLTNPFSRNKDVPFCELWEIRDWRTKEIIVICEEKLLLKDDDVLQVGGLPYEFLTLNEDPEYFWGIPDAYILSPQQKELNDVKTQQSKHRKIALLKFLYKKGSITEEQLNNFLSGDVGPAVAINDDSIQSAIVAMQPHMSPDLWKEAMVIENDITTNLGMSMNQAGGYNPKGGNVSATETAEVAEGFDLRMDERKDIVSDLMINIVKKWNAMIFTLWDQERVVQIVGPEGDTEWVSFTGKDIYCEYKLKIDPDSGFPLTSQAKRQLSDGLFKVYNGDPLIDQLALRRNHLDHYENLTPGVQSLLQSPQQIAPGGPNEKTAILGAARQPSPMGMGAGGGAGASSGSNRGGGQKPITPFNKFVKGEK